MAFEINNIGKLENRLEQECFEWALEDICSYYEITEISELTEEQAREIFEYSESADCDEPLTLLGMALRSLVDQWQNETGQQL